MTRKPPAIQHCITSTDDVIRRAFWPTQDFSDISNFAYTEDPDIVILNGPGTPMVGKLNCRTQKFLWMKPIQFLSSVTYHPKTRRVLGYANPQHALIELDADTGEVVSELKATELGPIGRCQNVRYALSCNIHGAFRVYRTPVEEDPDLVLLADGEKHVAGMMRLSTGKFVWRFGEYGVAGSDLCHLHEPRDVAWTMAGGAWIADYQNHRLLNVSNLKKKPGVTHQWIFPRPTSVSFTYNTAGSGFFSANAAVATEGRYQPLTLVLSDFDEVGLDLFTSLLGWAPIASNLTAFNPWNPLLLQVNQWNSAFEIEWMKTPQAWKHMTRFAKPYALRQNIPVGNRWYSEPVVGLINDRMLVKILSTTDVRATIEVPSPALRLLGTPAEFQWTPVTDIPVGGGRITAHCMDFPPAVFRIAVVPEKTDVQLDVHVEGY